MNKTCEICNKNYPTLDNHHIQSRSKGGSNQKWNIAEICQNCHKSVHLGLIILEGRFNTTNGNKLIWRKFNNESITGMTDPEVFLLPDSEKYRNAYLKRI